MNLVLAKKIRYIVLITTIVILLYGCSKNTKHLGEWKSTTENTELILDNSNHATFIVDNKVTGGDDFILHGEKRELKYNIDYSKNPIWLDLIVTYKKNNQMYEARLKGIVKFLTDKKIEYRTNLDPDAPRPTGFDKGEILILDKQN